MAQGIPSIDVEAGGRNVVDQEAVAFIERGVRRVLAHLAVLPRPFRPLSTSDHARAALFERRSHRGVASRTQGRGAGSEGDLLGTLTDWHGRELATLRAPEAGLVLLIMSAPPVSAGETLVVLAP